MRILYPEKTYPEQLTAKQGIQEGILKKLSTAEQEIQEGILKELATAEQSLKERMLPEKQKQKLFQGTLSRKIQDRKTAYQIALRQGIRARKTP